MLLLDEDLRKTKNGPLAATEDSLINANVNMNVDNGASASFIDKLVNKVRQRCSKATQFGEKESCGHQ